MSRNQPTGRPKKNAPAPGKGKGGGRGGQKRGKKRGEKPRADKRLVNRKPHEFWGLYFVGLRARLLRYKIVIW